MSKKQNLKPLIVQPSAGREYPMGRMSAIFKADLHETNSTLSVSEWWLDPNTEGPHHHRHPEAHLFYIIQGSLFVYLENQDWFEAEKGTYIFIPGEIEHGFENRSMEKAGFLSINTPGGFEKMAPKIVEYFEEHPLGDAISNS